jgi:hypothetical protein
VVAPAAPATLLVPFHELLATEVAVQQAAEAVAAVVAQDIKHQVDYQAVVVVVVVAREAQAVLAGTLDIVQAAVPAVLAGMQYEIFQKLLLGQMVAL